MYVYIYINKYTCIICIYVCIIYMYIYIDKYSRTLLIFTGILDFYRIFRTFCKTFHTYYSYPQVFSTSTGFFVHSARLFTHITHIRRYARLLQDFSKDYDAAEEIYKRVLEMDLVRVCVCVACLHACISMRVKCSRRDV